MSPTHPRPRLRAIWATSLVARSSALAAALLLPHLLDTQDAARLLYFFGLLQLSQNYCAATADGLLLSQGRDATLSLRSWAVLIVGSLLFSLPATLRVGFLVALPALIGSAIAPIWAVFRSNLIRSEATLRPYLSTITRDVGLVVLSIPFGPSAVAISAALMSLAVWPKAAVSHQRRAPHRPTLHIAVGQFGGLASMLLLRVTAGSVLDDGDLIAFEQVLRLGGIIPVVVSAGIGSELQRRWSILEPASALTSLRRTVIQIGAMSLLVGGLVTASAWMVPQLLSPSAGEVGLASLAFGLGAVSSLLQRFALARSMAGAFLALTLGSLIAVALVVFALRPSSVSGLMTALFTGQLVSCIALWQMRAQGHVSEAGGVQ